MEEGLHAVYLCDACKLIREKRARQHPTDKFSHTNLFKAIIYPHIINLLSETVYELTIFVFGN